jgi:hypothetical protein
VRGYSDIGRPLHKLCEKKARFVWTDNCQEAFEKLKSALTTAPILAYPKNRLIQNPKDLNSKTGMSIHP